MPQLNEYIRAKLSIYLTVLGSLVICDGIWLGLITQDSYQQAMGHIMRQQVIIWPWVVFYLCYPLAVISLAVLPQSSIVSIKSIAIRGFILGLAAYGTYNLTNYALVVDWPLWITLKDWLWGALITSFSAWAGGVALRATSKVENC